MLVLHFTESVSEVINIDEEEARPKDRSLWNISQYWEFTRKMTFYSYLLGLVGSIGRIWPSL